MTRAIIVHINTTNPSLEELTLLAQDVQEACEAHGLDVESAVPWNPPLASGTPLGAVALPPPPPPVI